MNMLHYVITGCLLLVTGGMLKAMGHSAESAGTVARHSLTALERTAPILLMTLRTNEPVQLLVNSASHSIKRTAKQNSLWWIWSVRH